MSNSILSAIYNQNPMNLLRKLTELSAARLLSRYIRISVTKKEFEDFMLLALVCFMIIIYKINKAA
jgi:hypothetical protein